MYRKVNYSTVSVVKVGISNIVFHFVVASFGLNKILNSVVVVYRVVF